MNTAKFIYRKSDNRFIGGGYYDVQPPMVGDPPMPDLVNYGVAEFSDADLPGATDVFDEVLGKRPMTAAELAIFFPAPARQLSRFEFMSLLTPQERIGLRTRAASDPVLNDALSLLELASFVDPAHPMIAQMLGYVESIGVMTAARRAAFAAAILAASKVA